MIATHREKRQADYLSQLDKPEVLDTIVERMLNDLFSGKKRLGSRQRTTGKLIQPEQATIHSLLRTN